MITLTGQTLTIQEIVQVAREATPVRLASESREAVQRSRARVEKILSRKEPVYGINTGFGIFSEQQISPADTRTLNRNLILSHAVGAGVPLAEEVVRAAMLIRANTLAKGYSGVRLVVIETLLEMLNKGVSPVVPAQGSLGSSGDLAPLAHLALVFSTDDEDREADSGTAVYRGRLTSGKQAMESAGIPRLILEAKEGLALSNGATFSAAIAALACADSRYLMEVGEIALALSLEALLGSSAAFDHRIHQARLHPGQINTAAQIRQLIEGSTLIDSTDSVQDAYSLRCAPQVLGPVRETLEFAETMVNREVNAATDNPLIFAGETALSGGNFHGEALGLVMDYLGIALTELAAISERRVFRLTDSTLNAGLPPMLVDAPDQAGLNSGVMMLQYTSASLVLENRSLATPDSTNSLPTSAEKEDHNANSMTAARHTRQIIENTCQVLALETYTAVRALELRIRELPGAQLGRGTAAAFEVIREAAPYQAGDIWWRPEVDKITELIRSQKLIWSVRQALDHG